MSGAGLRFDTGKSNLAALDNEFIEAIALTQTYGAMKYANRNWEKGMDWSKVYSPLLRHCLKFWAGLECDTESYVHHFGHIGCNLAYLFEYERRGMGNDDLMIDKIPNPEATADKIPPVARKDYKDLHPIRYDLVPPTFIYALGFANGFLPYTGDVGLAYARMMDNIYSWKNPDNRVGDGGYSRILLAAVDAMRLHTYCLIDDEEKQEELSIARGIEYAGEIDDDELETCCKGIC